MGLRNRDRGGSGCGLDLVRNDAVRAAEAEAKAHALEVPVGAVDRPVDLGRLEAEVQRVVGRAVPFRARRIRRALHGPRR
jgi:hypothetical protein